MANVGLLPNEFHDNSGGRLLTFVVPALTGCNLRCRFCIIRQRNEFERRELLPQDYVRFVREAAAHSRVFGLAIQGYEPLLPDALPYTRAILAIGRLLGLRTSLITNGIDLQYSTELLQVLNLSQLGISLDSPIPTIHDKLRGKVGAWQATLNGIRQAKLKLEPSTGLAVASVLLPNNKGQLEDMPALLDQLGINYWLINPLFRIKNGKHSTKFAELSATLADLNEAATRYGIQLILDDELGCLQRDPDWAEARQRSKIKTRTVPSNVEIFRLIPSGECSADQDILTQLTEHTLQWMPNQEHAGAFLDRVAAAKTNSAIT